VSRRSEIQMSEEEILAFLDEQRVVTCATLGKDGWPHLMPLWYVVRDGDVWAWTFAKSQKVRNLERDPRATIQVEAGDQYHELRGVMMKTEVEIIRDVEAITGLGAEITERYAGTGLDEQGRAFIAAQALKRVGLHFVPQAKASWDHAKLGGGY